MLGGAGPGTVAAPVERDPAAPAQVRPKRGSETVVFTDDEAARDAASAESVAARAAEARKIAALIARALDIRRPDPSDRRSSHGRWATALWRGGPGDIDIEATVERRLADDAGAGPIVVREQVARRRAVVLLVDASGSSRGRRLLLAAAAVGALLGTLDHDDVAVIAFWSDAATLVELGRHAEADSVVERLALLPARGLTNVAFPLELAARALAGAAGADEHRVVLLSDCVHNAGPDPRVAAARLPRLDVLLDVTGECDRELGAQLAVEGRGRVFRVDGPPDIAAALTAVFAG